jgi:integrase
MEPVVELTRTPFGELLQGRQFGRVSLLALMAGMRPGEYPALRWEDID